jgi:hypothetical protein
LVTGSLGVSPKSGSDVYVYAGFTDSLSKNILFARGAIWGTLSAHELGHKFAGVPNAKFDADNPNLMSLGDNPNQTEALLNSWQLPKDVLFTPDQMKAIFEKCKTLRKCDNGKCGSGDGGGGSGPPGGGGGIVLVPILGAIGSAESYYIGIVGYILLWTGVMRK